ncbi:glycerophosphoryl diester phosphodiesterase [Neokomagataea thailandica NBRC 106555]|uniref:glycerophosphodiester phosphodiesterase n=2 Tax=Neokomagataea TaxID=1223423 RepID=A0A4Y6VA19_9PROT|nr:MULTISPECIES: glycerophosphodiester phosphodiesterase family protein [Neokomagataea]QDH25336.1 glycerophosphodiester phosphodiesterase [Neokomagataea tanensis]GBR54318.1 glycerophosphoryl diester phosphodiesterase [Neokomagataea thailandica NBRC 106555]
MLTRRKTLGLLTAASMAPAIITPRAAKAAPSLAPQPLIFAHRGASALRPEHTFGAYAKAMQDGADYIEPDLVMTKDGHLVVRHEPNIAETTNVAEHPEFSSRRRTLTIDGEKQTGWFTFDFTLAEIKTLRARERLSTLRPQNTRYNDRFAIPTFEEMIELVSAEASATGKTFGIIPEIKHSTFFHSIGLDPETEFLKIIAAHEYTRQAPLELQSFETANLAKIRSQVLDINPQARLMFLMDDRNVVPADIAASGKKTTFGDLMTPSGLKEVRQFADVIGPSNIDIIPRDAQGAWLAPSTLISDAHAAGLLVHSYTARPENFFLPKQLRNSGTPAERNPAGMIAELRRYLDLGLDGFFTDDPAIGRLALNGPI